jgi:hypothetical protein
MQRKLPVMNSRLREVHLRAGQGSFGNFALAAGPVIQLCDQLAL